MCMGVCGSTQESGCVLAIVSVRMSLCQGLSKYVNARVFKCKSLAWKSEVVRNQNFLEAEIRFQF